jgi:hypothetical protein
MGHTNYVDNGTHADSTKLEVPSVYIAQYDNSCYLLQLTIA